MIHFIDSVYSNMENILFKDKPKLIQLNRIYQKLNAFFMT